MSKRIKNTCLTQAKYTQVNTINISGSSSVRIFTEKLNMNDLNLFGSAAGASSVPILSSLTVKWEQRKG